jgi:hypothetical protein
MKLRNKCVAVEFEPALPLVTVHRKCVIQFYVRCMFVCMKHKLYLQQTFGALNTINLTARWCHEKYAFLFLSPVCRTAQLTDMSSRRSSCCWLIITVFVSLLLVPLNERGMRFWREFHCSDYVTYLETQLQLWQWLISMPHGCRFLVWREKLCSIV